jgi:hypothetical protein
MRRILVILTGALAFAPACGGGTGSSGGGAVPRGEGSEAGAGGEMVSAEAYDDIQRFFKNKGRVVQVCYARAVQEGRLNRKAQGRLTSEMTIDVEGRPQNVHVTNDTLGSNEVKDCLAQTISSWTVPKPNTRFVFSFTYEFHAAE